MLCRSVLTLAVLAGLSLPSQAADSPSATVAHIKLTGSPEEGPINPDPLFGGATENFKTKLDRIRKAAKDPKIKGLLLEFEGFGLGWGRMDAMRQAISEFRATGKRAFAYLEEGSQSEYLIAIACDEVFMPEGAWLMLTGMQAQMTFYKDMFEKLKIKADFLQMGDFKGAAEPFTRSAMSPALRKQMEIVIDDYFEKSYVETIVKSRPSNKWVAAQVKRYIDEGPYSAAQAAKLGLIDGVLFPDQLKERMQKSLKTEAVKVTRNYGQTKSEDIDLSTLTGVLKLFAPPKKSDSKAPKIAVIYCIGGITTGRSSGGFMGEETMGSTTICEAIRQAEKDSTVKAIVLRIDSPGGSALASDLIWRETLNCSKPVIASMGDTAASGGYYIAMGAKKIYAEPSTLTGSIGVVGGKIVLGGLYDMIGLKSDVITRGTNAGLFSSLTPFSKTERASFESLMRDTYDQFLDKALAGRKKAGVDMTKDKLLTLAGGRVWTGRQAKAAGLVDELGTLENAIAAAKSMTDLPKDSDPELLILPKSKSFLDQLMESKSDALAPEIRVLRNIPEMAPVVRNVRMFLAQPNERLWLIAPCEIRIR